MKLRTSWRRGAAGGAAAAMLAIASFGCGERMADPGAPATPSSNSALRPGAEEILTAFRGLMMDFSPAKDLGGLVALSDLRVTGTVTEVVAGRIAGAQSTDDRWAQRIAAVAVDVNGSSGEALASPEDTVWIEIQVDPGPLQKAFVPGTPIEAYLVPATKTQDDFPYGEEGSGIPEGAVLWMPAHPEGLTVEYGDGEGTVVPLAHEVRAGSHI